MLWPAKPINAGRSVSDEITITATTIAAPMPIKVIIGIPATARPQIAITTVPPAITTA
ncbi:unannotated protein [freshwater metagenome]|uniref:Unannotated protein n=1 Tax=freshwater metagenome TaxID=449393 RepID=A0A6J6EPA5_9ZZZZ